MIPGDDLSETKRKIYQLVIGKRKEKQKFYHLKHWDKKPWAEGAEATGIFQRSSISACGEREAGKENKLVMLCPELFQMSEAFSSATAHKDNISWRAEMGEVYSWMLSMVDDCTIVAATDAGSPKIRYKLQENSYGHEKTNSSTYTNTSCTMACQANPTSASPAARSTAG